MAFKRKEYHHEENCLNCGYPLVGKFCGNCGQKAFLHKDSFLHMAAHFVGDYFHYDSKFWLTVKALFAKPGLATLEFINGKRAKYLNPIQLYFFVTTVFFLLVFSLSGSESQSGKVENKRIIDSLYKTHYKDTLMANGVQVDSSGEVDFELELPQTEARNLHDYDSIQNSLPDSRKDGMFTSFFIRKEFGYNEKYKSAQKINDVFLEKFTRNIPKTLFLLLPYFAFLLFVINFRKKFYYIDHIIFSLHFHVVLFMSLILAILIGAIVANSVFNIFIGVITFFGIGLYLFKSLKRVYQSSFSGTLGRVMFLFAGYLIGFFCVALILIFFTFLTM